MRLSIFVIVSPVMVVNRSRGRWRGTADGVGRWNRCAFWSEGGGQAHFAPKTPK
jgi:hypothetical protein